MPPPSLSALSMSRGSPQRETSSSGEGSPPPGKGSRVRWEAWAQPCFRAGWHRAAACLHPLTLTHFFQLLSICILDFKCLLSAGPRVVSNGSNTTTRTLCYHGRWHEVISFYLTLRLPQHQCASCCEDLTDLLPALCPRCLRCGWACQRKVASAPGLTWPADCCLEATSMTRSLVGADNQSFRM